MLPKSIKDFNKLIDSKYGFISYFDPNSGFYIRTEDPFMASFPQLLDIGIMGHCNLGLTGRCLEIGIQCYQSGPVINEPNMQFEDFKHIIDKSAGRVFQIALGGRGDPELHKDFEEILAYAVKKV